LKGLTFERFTLKGAHDSPEEVMSRVDDFVRHAMGVDPITDAMTATATHERPFFRRAAQTLDALLGGASEKEIADRMGLSVHTVHQYVKTVYRALGVRSRAELMARCMRPR
jgi:DNA-binding NarL/FixJ family response regulator